MQQGRADRVSEYTLRLVDPTLCALAAKGYWSPEQLTLDEFERFMNLCRAGFLSGEDSVLQHRAGLLDDAAFRSFVEGVRGALRRSGHRAAWQVSSRQYGPEYVAFMDGIVKENASSATTRTGRFEECVESCATSARGPSAVSLACLLSVES